MLSTRAIILTTYVLKASDQGSSGKKGSATAGLLGRKPNSSTVRGSPTGSNNDDDMLFAANKHGRLASIYANEPHLKQPLDPRYIPRVQCGDEGFLLSELHEYSSVILILTQAGISE